MPLPEPLNEGDLQRFLDNPQQLASQPAELQLAIANYPATPRNLLEVLVSSSDRQVAEAARMHVTWAGEMTEGWQEALDVVLQNAQLGQNDRLAVELVKFAPVPDCFLSEWVPSDRLIQGLRNPYLPMRYRLKLLQRLAQEPTLEPRLQVAESPLTPLAVLQQLAGDLELPIRLAVKFNPNCPPDLLRLLEGQHEVASDWNTDSEQLAMLAQSRWDWIRLTVAQNPNTPSNALIQLAGDAIAKIQLAVARNPSTPTAALEVLGNHRSNLGAIAEHPHASEQILLQLLPEFKRTIAQRLNLPRRVLEQLVNEDSDKNFYSLPNYVIERPNFPGEILARLAQDSSEYTRARVAKHPQVLVSTLEQLAQDPDAKVRLAVAQNSKTPEPLRIQLLEQLATNADEQIKAAIARDPQTPVTILEQLANSAYTGSLIVDLLRQMAPNASPALLNAVRTFIDNHDSPNKILFWLRQDAVFRDPILQEWRQLLASLNESERTMLGSLGRSMLPAIGLSGGVSSEDRWLNQYRALSPEFDLYCLLLLFGLASGRENRGSRAVALALVGNPSTPTAIREQLQEQLTESPDDLGRYKHDADLRMALAFNPAIPEQQRMEYFRQAINSSGNNIREAIAIDPRTPVSILEYLFSLRAGDKQMVIRNPNAPASAFRELANDSNSTTRNWIAENPSAPVDVLIQLAKDTDGGVRSNALENPNLPPMERYCLLLAKEEEEETAKANQLLASRPNSLYALAQLLEKGDRNAFVNAARNPLTPVHILQQIAKHPDETVRGVLLEKQDLPMSIRLELTRDPSVSIRSRLACKHPYRETPVQVLEVLALDESEQVRAFVAENPHTPIEVLVKLANDPSRTVKVKVASNPNTPTTILTRLGLEEDIYDVRNPNTPGVVLAEAVNTIPRRYGYKAHEVLANFLKHPVQGSQMPASTLEQLANHNSNSVRYRVAQHPNTSASTLEKLSRDDYVPTVRAVASHSNTPPHVLERLATHPDYTTRDSVAGNPNTPPAALELLARYNESEANAPSTSKDALKSMMPPAGNNQIRKRVARNPRTPLAVLEMLASREFVKGKETGGSANPLFPPTTIEEVLEALLYNPSLTPQILARLALDPSPKIRSLLVRHPNATPELWAQLAQDEDASVRGAIASHPNCPPPILETLALDDEEDIRQKVAANPNTPGNILEFLSEDPDAGVRDAIAANPNTTPTILERLAQDEKVEVRRAVAQNAHTPTSIRESLRDLLLPPITRESSPTLRGLSRVYNPNTDDLSTLLSEYAQSPNAFVRFVTLLHPLTAVEVLQQGAQSVWWLERYAVSDNPSTPTEIRQRLALDSNRIVRAAAIASLSA
ncbi:MAG TPA: HEAT repeat domain-containing protein [Candidatus Obscuribacterales bacterium]